MGKVQIGVSGWSYADWRGVFYPPGLPARQRLAFAARTFDTLEINRSFYSLLTPEVYRSWRDQTPDHVRFAVKGSRYITHQRKLKDVGGALANFLASGVLALGPKLGPILWQLPPNLPFDAARLEQFLAMLPHDTRAAERLAARHDERLRGRAWPHAEGHRRLRHALEVRHPSYRVPALVRLLRRAGVALVVADSDTWPRVEEPTAGFMYVRLHGVSPTYAGRYTDEALAHWAARIRRWQAGGEPRDARRITNRAPPPRKSRDVYVYFDNDQKARAPDDARRLKALLKEM